MKIKGGKTKVIVNQHALTLDGKLVWKKFKEHYEHHSIVSMNKAHFFELLSNMSLTDNFTGGAIRFLTDFVNTVTEMRISTGETMADSDLVGFLTTAISTYEPFSSIKASLDTNALMNKKEITFDGMLHVLYNNFPKKSNRLVKNASWNREKGRSQNDHQHHTDNEWKKDFTKWVPIKLFKELAESEQRP